jgi:hypothetical protein
MSEEMTKAILIIVLTLAAAIFVWFLIIQANIYHNDRYERSQKEKVQEVYESPYMD